MFINTYINDLHISEGDSYRGDCPMCRGKNTFTATKMDGRKSQAWSPIAWRTATQCSHPL